MPSSYENLITTTYAAFNNRDIAAALTAMHTDIDWPMAFKGGYISGHEAIRDYWTAQWQEINPIVVPVKINERPDGRLEITVDQKVKDLQGNTLFDGIVKHVYTIQDDLLRRMDIEVEAE